MTNSKIPFKGTILSVQPRIRLIRSFDAREFLEGPKDALPKTPLWGLSPATLKC